MEVRAGTGDLRAGLWARKLLENSECPEGVMNSDELVSKMIAQSVPENLGFGDWADVLYLYAAVLERIEGRLAPNELEELVGIGAKFYRTLARSEEYRQRSGSPLPPGRSSNG